MCTTCSECSQMCTLMSKEHLYNAYNCTCTGAQNTCSKVHATLTAKKMHIYIYIHIYVYAYISTRIHMRIYDVVQTRWRTATETHNLCTSIHTHTYTHVYTCIRIHIHIHMHIYTYIHVCTHIYMNIHTHTRTICTYARMQAPLKRRRGRDCAGSPTWRQEAPLFFLSAAIWRWITPSWPSAQLPVHEERWISAEQTQPTAAHHTITTARRPDHNLSSALVRSRSTQFAQVGATEANPRNEVTFLPFWQVFRIEGRKKGPTRGCVLFNETGISAHHTVDILRGLPEGSRLSPTLFGIFVADVVHELRAKFPQGYSPWTPTAKPTHLLIRIYHAHLDRRPTLCWWPSPHVNMPARTVVYASSLPTLEYPKSHAN